MNPTVFLVVGPPQNGKSTARAAISTLTGLHGAPCSDVIYGHLARQRGASVAELKALPKELVRPDLIALGNWLRGETPFNSPDGLADGLIYVRRQAFMVRELFFSGARVIDGLRRRAEMTDSIEFIKSVNHTPYIIHVSRPGSPPIVDNSEPLDDFADSFLVNDGTSANLTDKVHRLLKSIAH